MTSSLPLIATKLLVHQSPIHGYGVFADQDFLAGEIIEESYVIIRPHLMAELTDYIFKVGNDYLLALGRGSIFNHANEPNASYEVDLDREVIVFRANQAIKRGEEIFISYGKSYFDTRKLSVKAPSFRYQLKKFLPLISIVWRFGLIAGTICLALKFLHQ